MPVAARYLRAGLAYRADLITEELPTRLTLARALEAGPLEPGTWRAVGRCIASLHARGVQHADLNAHNLLLGAEGRSTCWISTAGASARAARGKARVLERLHRSLAKVTRGLPAGRFGDAEWRLLQDGVAGQ